jgi:hypothetical protein
MSGSRGVWVRSGRLTGHDRHGRVCAVPVAETRPLAPGQLCRGQMLRAQVHALAGCGGAPLYPGRNRLGDLLTRGYVLGQQQHEQLVLGRVERPRGRERDHGFNHVVRRGDDIAVGCELHYVVRTVALNALYFEGQLLAQTVPAFGQPSACHRSHPSPVNRRPQAVGDHGERQNRAQSGRARSHDCAHDPVSCVPHGCVPPG